MSIESDKESKRRWYQKNKNKVVLASRKRKAEFQQLVDAVKSAPCMDCGQKFPPMVMDFDHVRGEKIADVSVLVGRGNAKALADEIEKCDVVCANCHRIRTAVRNRTLQLLNQGWQVNRGWFVNTETGELISNEKARQMGIEFVPHPNAITPPWSNG